jgi:hypothetical protein
MRSCDRRRWTMKTVAGVATLAAMLSPACGGGGSSPSTPSATPAAAAPTPVACTQSFLFQGSGSVPAETLVGSPVVVGTAGRLDVILDWTFADSDIGVYVAQGSCDIGQFNARTCNFVIRSESGAKPRKVSSSVSAGTYLFLIANYASREESASTQVILSSSGCPGLTSNAAIASGSATRRALEHSSPFAASH